MYSQTLKLLVGALAVLIGTAAAMLSEAWISQNLGQGLSKVVLSLAALGLVCILVSVGRKNVCAKAPCRSFTDDMVAYGGIPELDNIQYPYLAVSTNPANPSLAFRDMHSAVAFINWIVDNGESEDKSYLYVLAHLGAIWTKHVIPRPDDSSLDAEGNDIVTGLFWPDGVFQVTTHHPAFIKR